MYNSIFTNTYSFEIIVSALITAIITIVGFVIIYDYLLRKLRDDVQEILTELQRIVNDEKAAEKENRELFWELQRMIQDK